MVERDDEKKSVEVVEPSTLVTRFIVEDRVSDELDVDGVDESKKSLLVLVEIDEKELLE